MARLIRVHVLVQFRFALGIQGPGASQKRTRALCVEGCKDVRDFDVHLRYLLTASDELIAVIGSGQRDTFLGEIENVFRLIADSLDLLQQQRVAEHERDIATTTNGDVHDEFRSKTLFSRIDPLILAEPS